MSIIPQPTDDISLFLCGSKLCSSYLPGTMNDLHMYAVSPHFLVEEQVLAERVWPHVYESYQLLSSAQCQANVAAIPTEALVKVARQRDVYNARLKLIRDYQEDIARSADSNQSPPTNLVEALRLQINHFVLLIDHFRRVGCLRKKYPAESVENILKRYCLSLLSSFRQAWLRLEMVERAILRMDKNLDIGGTNSTMVERFQKVCNLILRYDCADGQIKDCFIIRGEKRDTLPTAAEYLKQQAASAPPPPPPVDQDLEPTTPQPSTASTPPPGQGQPPIEPQRTNLTDFCELMRRRLIEHYLCEMEPREILKAAAAVNGTWNLGPLPMHIQPPVPTATIPAAAPAEGAQKKSDQ